MNSNINHHGHNWQSAGPSTSHHRATRTQRTQHVPPHPIVEHHCTPEGRRIGPLYRIQPKTIRRPSVAPSRSAAAHTAARDTHASMSTPSQSRCAHRGSSLFLHLHTRPLMRSGQHTARRIPGAKLSVNTYQAVATARAHGVGSPRSDCWE